MGATHRHRYFGVLAPNSPHRAAVTQMAQSAAEQPVQPAQVQVQVQVQVQARGALGVSNPLPTRACPAGAA